MGVPAFYRWLSQKYPKTVVDVVEETPQEANGVVIPIDTSQPNPNGTEYDNLYLDMNGIIHPCSHPENKAQPKSEGEIMNAIFEYIDRIFAIVRPRKLLYMAIDGVAPRAKMNQQRSRRFRSAKEAEQKKEIERQINEERVAQGQDVTEPDPNVLEFDSNCITPGTKFMDAVAISLRWYIAKRQTSDPGWKNLKVILSDSNSPGEGEHKIMEYIRLQRVQPDYDPHIRHVIYGLDADLIMLSLATHEPYFSILREVVFFGNNNNCYVCGQPGHMAHECQGKAKEQQGEGDEKDVKKKPYQFLHVNVLREYLHHQLYNDQLPFPFDLERVIDDWVFMCFFVGNDFLPHLPTLEIREGAIDKLVNVYKRLLPLVGYITDAGEVNIPNAEKLLVEVGQLEDGILTERLQRERQQKERRKRQRQNQRQNQREVQRRAAARADEQRAEQLNKERNMAAAEKLKAALLGQIELKDSTKSLSEDGESGSRPPTKKLRIDEAGSSVHSSTGDEDDEEEEIPDPVRLGEPGWKERYYKQKFGVEMDDRGFFQGLSHSYLEGLCWVLKYYYQGCCSWKWYFPYHYAPFASELVDLSVVPVEFQLEKPFSPLEQLMAVLPARSAQLVPEAFRDLMTNPDSPIIDFYPEDFKIDLNGKKMAWQGVALLPFIDEKRLLDALNERRQHLTRDEIRRDSTSDDLLYVSLHHKMSPAITALYTSKQGQDEWTPMDASVCEMNGFIAPDSIQPSNFIPGTETLEDIKESRATWCKVRNPKLPEGKSFVKGLLKGVTMPPLALNPQDFFTGPRPYRTQNHAANRMINHYTDSSQYKRVDQRRPYPENRDQVSRGVDEFGRELRDVEPEETEDYDEPRERYDDRRRFDRKYDDRRDDRRHDDRRDGYSYRQGRPQTGPQPSRQHSYPQQRQPQRQPPQRHPPPQRQPPQRQPQHQGGPPLSNADRYPYQVSSYGQRPYPRQGQGQEANVIPPNTYSQPSFPSTLFSYGGNPNPMAFFQQQTPSISQVPQPFPAPQQSFPAVPLQLGTQQPQLGLQPGLYGQSFAGQPQQALFGQLQPQIQPQLAPQQPQLAELLALLQQSQQYQTK